MPEQFKNSWTIEVQRLKARISELIAENANLRSELHEDFEQSISIIHDQGAENLKLKEEIAELKSLVDGAKEVVEIFPISSPAQIEWKATWLNKARAVQK